MPSLLKLYVMHALTIAVGTTIGLYFDRQETMRLTGYRDKSALFGRELKPGEPPSWP